MPPKFLRMQQNTAEWLDARKGFVTASRIVDVVSYNQPSSADAKAAGFKLVRDAVVAGLRGEPSASRDKYMHELRAERLTGKCSDRFVSKYMEHGLEFEQYARDAYEVAFDVMVDRIGFAIHADLNYSGASPDALVNEDGMIEIKCPQIETHFTYMESKGIPEEYEPQMMWGMEVCGRKWCDFVSYHPDAPDGLKIYVARLDYNAARAELYRSEVIKFNGDVEASIVRLTGKSEAWSPRDLLKEQLRRSVEREDEALILDEDIAWIQAKHAAQARP